MCGEHYEESGYGDAARGSSPHVRGALRIRSSWSRMTGSSPHVRGALFAVLFDLRVVGIIPACAGSTPSYRLRLDQARDHPRMCGEHRSVLVLSHLALGSSPHVRGALGADCRPLWMSGIIPACAGSTVNYHYRQLKAGDHPRMCGEHYCCCSVCFSSPGSSPHVRGAPIFSDETWLNTGIIPACAGSTQTAKLALQDARDHPRMCGEHCIVSWLCSARAGSSPHVRGARFR